MCGILGWVNPKRGLKPREVALARHALGLLAHRGPDFQGEWHDERAYMGHRRLSIIDRSADANQPFHDPTGRFVLSYNGEVYNYVELRKELERQGLGFHTKSDTEVVLAALIHWGRSALERFDGMFAAALHDRHTGSHLLFRDPLGQKPLYYHIGDKGLVYGSELRALLALNGHNWRIDRAAFRRFLVNGFHALEETPVVGIKKLLPGCWLEISDQGVRTQRYWESIPGDDPIDVDEAGVVAEFERLFDSSCAIAMRSDVPYGVFLSGGIDSSLILNSCRAANPEIRSFSVAMEEVDFDESAKAALISRHLAIERPHTFTMNREAVVEATDALFASNDEPHGDPGFVNTYFLAKCCRPHLTVAIAGDGGDELFGGYAPFVGLRGVPWLRGLPSPLLGALKGGARLLPDNDRYLGLAFKLRAYLQGFPASDAIRFPLWLAAIGPEELADLCFRRDDGRLSRSGAPGSLYEPERLMLNAVEGHSDQQVLLYYYQKVFLPEFVSHHTDRAAMQFGLEVRSPFLSRPLIEFANRLPDHFRVRRGKLKWLLTRVAENRGFPREIVRQRKQGFTFPLARWLKGPLKARMDDLLDERDLSASVVDPALIDRFRDDHLAGRRNNYRILYNLMAFHAWRRNYPGLEFN